MQYMEIAAELTVNSVENGYLVCTRNRNDGSCHIYSTECWRKWRMHQVGSTGKKRCLRSSDSGGRDVYTLLRKQTRD